MRSDEAEQRALAALDKLRDAEDRMKRLEQRRDQEAQQERSEMARRLSGTFKSPTDG
jgi:hypothetical protein